MQPRWLSDDNGMAPQGQPEPDQPKYFATTPESHLKMPGKQGALKRLAQMPNIEEAQIEAAKDPAFPEQPLVAMRRQKVIAVRARPNKAVDLGFRSYQLLPLAMALAVTIVFARHFDDAPVKATPRPPVVKMAPPAIAVEPEPITAPMQDATPVLPASKPDTEILEAKVQNWASAWSSGDVETYLAHYSESFRPSNGLTHPQWEKQRRQRLGQQSATEIKVTDLHVVMNGEHAATAHFAQNFKSTGIAETATVKELELIRVGDDWRIASERTVSSGKTGQ